MKMLKPKTGLSLLLLAILSWFSVNLASASVPQDLIRNTADEVLKDIKQNQQQYRQDPAQLYKLVEQKVLPHFDFERMTNLALGRYKRKVKVYQKPELIKAFQQLLVRTYSKALLEYNDQKLVYLPMRGKESEGEVTVRTEIEQKGGFPIPLNYELYLKDEKWKVYDIIVDNISLVTNYRSTFAREIKSKGVESLIKTLQDRNQDES